MPSFSTKLLVELRRRAPCNLAPVPQGEHAASSALMPSHAPHLESPAEDPTPHRHHCISNPTRGRQQNGASPETITPTIAFHSSVMLPLRHARKGPVSNSRPRESTLHAPVPCNLLRRGVPRAPRPSRVVRAHLLRLMRPKRSDLRRVPLSKHTGTPNTACGCCC